MLTDIILHICAKASALHVPSEGTTSSVPSRPFRISLWESLARLWKAMCSPDFKCSLSLSFGPMLMLVSLAKTAVREQSQDIMQPNFWHVFKEGNEVRKPPRGNREDAKSRWCDAKPLNFDMRLDISPR